MKFSHIDLKEQMKQRKKVENLRRLGLESSDLEDLDFLTRFWHPAPHQRLLALETGEVVYTAPFAESAVAYPEQIPLGSGEFQFMGYIQDYLWYPTQLEFDGLLSRFGASVSSSEVRYQRLFFARPSTLREYCALLSQLRLASVSSGRGDATLH
jgi:hypothetical protein